MTFKKVGFVVKHHHAEASALALELAALVLEAPNRSVYFADESKALASKARTLKGTASKRLQFIPKPKLMDVCDLVVVLGGDGTFLSVARLLKSRSVPILGINMGTLGFLTEIKKSEAFTTLGAILAGVGAGRSPVISKRSLLEVTVHRGKKVVFQGPVVNDAVISKGAIARIIGVGVRINGKEVSEIRADGVIVGTPTGSTAYSLAAGGPILEPSLPALVITAICPHSLTQRPLVVADDSTIEMCLKHRPGHVFLTLDGQDAIDLREGDVVTVRKFRKHFLQLICSPDRDYFSLLREKLRFGTRD